MTKPLARLPLVLIVPFVAACGGSGEDIRTDDDPQTRSMAASAETQTAATTAVRRAEAPQGATAASP